MVRRALAMCGFAILVAGALRGQAPTPSDTCGAGPLRITSIADSLYAYNVPRADGQSRAEHNFIRQQVRAAIAAIGPIPPLQSGRVPQRDRMNQIPVPAVLDRESRLLVWFQVRDDGRLTGAQVQRMSGFPLLDSIAPRAIVRADSSRALQPLPRNLAGQPIDLWLAVGFGKLAGAENTFVAAVSRLDSSWTNETAPRFKRVGRLPAYPPAAMSHGIEERDIFEFVVDTIGRVEDSTIVLIHGTYREFVNAAIEGLRTVEFEPGRIGRCKVRVRIQQPINFSIGR